MPWIDPTAGNLNWYAIIRQITRAILHRRQVIGFYYGAHVSRVWFDGGTVPGGVTETSFTTTQAWRGGVGSGDGPYADPWNGNETDVYASASWILVFDHCDPDLIVKTPIVSWTNAGALTYDNVRDYVTSKQIPALSDLVGRRWYIIRGDRDPAPVWPDNQKGGVWSSDLVYEWPNDREQAKGTVAEYHDDPDHPDVVTSPTHATLKDDAGTYGGADVVGHDLLVYADDGFLKRVTITALEGRTFTFATQTWTPAVGGNYCVVNVGGRAYPGRVTDSPFAWYRGMRSGLQSAYLGTHGSINKPVQSIQLPVFRDGSCTSDTLTVFDRLIRTEDQPSEDDMGCGLQPEFYYSRDRDKTIRGLQVAIEELGPFFVDTGGYTGSYVNTLRPAALFAKLGFDTIGVSGHTVNGDAGNGITFASSIAASLPTDPIKCHWLLRRTKTGNYKGGTGQLTASGLLADPTDSGVANFGPDDDDAGVTLLLAFGWTGFPPLEFAQLYPRTGWIADTLDGSAVDPPSIDYGDSGCAGLGVWFRRPKSTHYLKARVDSGFTKEGIMLEEGAAFAVGDVAMYAGRSFEHPNAVGFSGAPVEPDDPQGLYFGKMAVTHYAGGDESARTSAKSGRVAAGSTTRRIKCDGADFWFGGGVLRTESGTATSGSTTSLTDGTKTTEPDRCAWHAARFNGFASPYATFTVEVLISGADFDDDAAVIEKAVIATGNESTGVLTWHADFALSTSANARQWRIREPRYELNCWEGRKVTITMGDQTATRTILANDDDTLFLDTALPFTPDATATYRIADEVIGSVMRYTADGWLIATGADAVRLGVTTPVDFTANPTFNLPYLLRRYGRHTMRDTICAKLFADMQRALDLLQYIHLPADWEARTEPGLATPVTNVLGSSGDSGEAACSIPPDGSYCVASPTTGTIDYVHLGDGTTQAEYLYVNSVSGAGEERSVPPQAAYTHRRTYALSTETANGYGEKPNDRDIVTIETRWNRLVAALYATRGCGLAVTADIDWLVYAQVDALDRDDGLIEDAVGELVKYHFEAGTTPVAYREWTVATSTPGADAVAGGVYQSGRIGGGTGPTIEAPGRPPAPPSSPPWDPDTSGGKTYQTRGQFYCADKLAIVKYSFPIPAA